MQGLGMLTSLSPLPSNKSPRGLFEFYLKVKTKQYFNTLSGETFLGESDKFFDKWQIFWKVTKILPDQ